MQNYLSEFFVLRIFRKHFFVIKKIDVLYNSDDKDQYGLYNPCISKMHLSFLYCGKRVYIYM